MAARTMATRSIALVDSALALLLQNGSISGCIGGGELCASLVQPASIDLPIGSRCVLVREKVLPFEREVRDLLKREDKVLEERELPKGETLLLLKGQTYLFPCCKLDLPDHLKGSLSPKSSIGRVDLMVRGIFDGCGLYDTITGAGELWLEVTPRSFNVRVGHGQTLSQLMVFDSKPEEAPPGSEASPLSGPFTLSFDASGEKLEHKIHRDALILSLNLKPSSTGSVGFEALPTSATVDLTKIGTHNPVEYFRPVLPNPERGCVTLEKDKFYILSTKELVSIPVHLSAEMVPFSQHVGELRAHYAGFFDPGFGYGKSGEQKGTVAVLEVRPHETITVYDGQPICLMEFFYNAQAPEKPYGQAGNSYHLQQGPKLAKYFSS